MNRFIIVACLGLLAVGCGRKNDVPVESQKPGYLVIFSQCNNAEPYRSAQNNLFTELFSKHDDVEFVIHDGQADAAKQISQIERAILQKPDLLIVAPLERNALSPVMGQAMDAGIPTICLERDIVDPNFTTFISADNVAIGRLAGQFIVDALTAKNGSPKGSVVEFTGMSGVQAATDRHNGAFEVLDKYPEIKVVHQATANWFQSEAMPRMEEALAANETIDVVYGHNDPMAYGAYLAAKEAGREKQTLFVGVDGLENEGAKYVSDGILGATFVYPLCADKAYELGMKMIQDATFAPEKTYILESSAIVREK